MRSRYQRVSSRLLTRPFAMACCSSSSESSTKSSFAVAAAAGHEPTSPPAPDAQRAERDRTTAEAQEAPPVVPGAVSVRHEHILLA